MMKEIGAVQDGGASSSGVSAAGYLHNGTIGVWPMGTAGTVRMNLTLESEPDERLVRVACRGSVSSQDLEPDRPDPLVALAGGDVFSRGVLLDLRRATFLDSSGVSWLISRHSEFRTHGGILVLHSVPPMVQQVLDLLRLASVLHIAPDADTAASIAAGGGA
jgi:anti-anti-sigma factor